MAVTRVVTLVNGIQKEVVPATTSAGAATAGQVVALNPSGQIDSTMLPATSSNGPSMVVPRNLHFHMFGVDGSGSTFTQFNAYKYGPQQNMASDSTNQFSFSGQDNHEAKTDVFQFTSGSSITECSSLSMTQPRIPAGYNCSSRITCSLQTTSDIIAWVSLLDTGLYNVTNVAGSPDIGYAANVGMIALRYYPGDTTWKLYITDGAHPGQIIDTGVAPNVVDVNGRVPCQVFDAFYTSNNVLTVAIDGVVVVGPMSPTNTFINADSVYAFGENRGWGNTLLIQGTTTTPVSANWAFGYLGGDGDKS